MLIIVAGRTAPNRAVRFGAEASPLDQRGRRDVLALRSSLTFDGPLRAGPELSVTQSAALLSDDVLPIPELTSLDVGDWRGRAPEDIPSADLGRWFADPSSAPHGGESVEAFVARIRAAASGFDPAGFDPGGREGCVVVAKSVAQALLCTGPHDFFAPQLRPASLHRC